MEPQDQMLTALELANWLKVKVPTVRRWQLEGLPCFHVGRLCRYEPARVRLWLEQREQARAHRARAERQGEQPAA
jgi:hypothetical protein